jgi:hypothetical protein
MNQKFPQSQLSRYSIHKISKKICNYSYKRITQYRPRGSDTKINQRVLFIKEFLTSFTDPNHLVLVIDEVGFNKAL